ncbi:MAG: Flp pilus assembly protein CpaB [Planctomycetota bacterium]|jgi:pilus assembly protein CpaB
MAKIKLVPILIIVIGIGIASAASLLAYNKLQNRPITTIVKKESGDTLRVAVAKTDLSWGTFIDKSMIKMVPYLKESLPSGYFSDRLALEGRVLVFPLKINEPIFESKLAPVSVTTGGVAAVLKPKKRAMSVKVNKVIGISGFIFPGSRVDILVTTKHKRGGSTPISVTKTVLENILVLASGAQMGNDDKQQQSQKVVDVITLEVTPEEGEKLALATNTGTIQLALRNFADTEEVITPGSTTKTLLASYRKSELPKATKAASKPEIRQELYTVTVIKGTNVKEVIF